MIPKKIHYCWFSGKKLPEQFQKYIDSWKKFCPDYEIVRWDESNYDISQNAYMESAYKEKRWGFVPDYARFDIIYREGGIYLDTDVEVIKSLDSLLENPAFLGFESAKMINPGLGFGAERGNPVIKALRDMYEGISFYNEDGSLNLVPSPYYATEKLKEFGILAESKCQKSEFVTVYPTEYFGCKDYNSGEIHITKNSFSIHHYSCTWMTREERKNEERRRNFCNQYGDFWGNRVDGIYKRLFSSKINNTIKRQGMLDRINEHFFYSEDSNESRLKNFTSSVRTPMNHMEKVVLLTPAIKSVNLGDSYIEKRCIEELDFAANTANRVSTHVRPGNGDIEAMRKADLVLVTGSNLLSGNVHHSQWKLPKDFSALSQVCLMGCGWSGYGDCNDFSRRFYAEILNNGWIHSVRDRYTLEKLHRAGVENVLYTGCPTMWTLTEEHCASIPGQKGKAVVTALTSYQADPDLDSVQLQILFDHYDKVYFWSQTAQDMNYINSLLLNSEKERLIVLPNNLDLFAQILKSEKPDYIGNSLHAGIMALANGCRSKIIAIDNRAVEIGNDTNLPVLLRKDLKDELETAIYSTGPTLIKLPWDNINCWKEQFRK